MKKSNNNKAKKKFEYILLGLETLVDPIDIVDFLNESPMSPLFTILNISLEIAEMFSKERNKKLYIAIRFARIILLVARALLFSDKKRHDGNWVYGHI